jgi:hypothetical protein
MRRKRRKKKITVAFAVTITTMIDAVTIDESLDTVDPNEELWVRLYLFFSPMNSFFYLHNTILHDIHTTNNYIIQILNIYDI